MLRRSISRKGYSPLIFSTRTKIYKVNELQDSIDDTTKDPIGVQYYDKLNWRERFGSKLFWWSWGFATVLYIYSSLVRRANEGRSGLIADGHR